MEERKRYMESKVEQKREVEIKRGTERHREKKTEKVLHLGLNIHHSWSESKANVLTLTARLKE